jgi:hypothetical protein
MARSRGMGRIILMLAAGGSRASGRRPVWSAQDLFYSFVDNPSHTHHIAPRFRVLNNAALNAIGTCL